MLILGGLAAAGTGLGRLAEPVWNTLRVRQPVLAIDAAGMAAGQGVTLALLGGFRALVADLIWIRMYALWERRDLAGTDTLLRVVPAIDPRPLYFWLNGARIIAHDFAAWRIEAAGGHDVAPETLQQRITREQARRGLERLELALQHHPQSAELWIERGNIHLHRLADLPAAAESYRRAWEVPGGPYYAARLHAEVLRRSGRLPEALAWLARLHPTLPPEDEAAAADVVLDRIRGLEAQLGIPPARAYRPEKGERSLPSP